MGHFYYTPMENEVVTFVKKDKTMANVRAYFDNIKNTFYPDWKEICDELKMDSQWRAKKN